MEVSSCKQSLSWVGDGRESTLDDSQFTKTGLIVISVVGIDSKSVPLERGHDFLFRSIRMKTQNDPWALPHSEPTFARQASPSVSEVLP
jgi:hypothetical protein